MPGTCPAFVFARVDLALLRPPRFRFFPNQVVVKILVGQPLRALTFARPRLPRNRIVVLGWCLLSLGLDEASSAQQFDLWYKASAKGRAFIIDGPATLVRRSFGR